MKKLVLLCTTAMAVVPSAAYAQSTGTIETEKETIVITGTRAQRGVSGVVIQDSTKAKGLITQEFIAKQSPGQTLLNTINFIPGVNFTQNDAYGSSGGNLRIRGFDGNRISVTFDGVPLNDSGNYAVYPNQMLDPELIEQINVNLGATDVDSPTASAAGGTVNFRSIIPTDRPGGQVVGSVGTDNYYRVFGLAQIGKFTPFGTKAWIAASVNNYNHWRGNGEIKKWQINGKIYQPLGSGGDFISIAGHYNQNRNNNYNNPNLTDLRTLFGTSVIPSTLPTDGPLVIDLSKGQWRDVDSIAYPGVCRNTAGGIVSRPTPVNGTAQVDPGTGATSATNVCYTPQGPFASQALTNLLGVQINPSNTGNIRGQSRFTLADNLILTIDPTYQYVLANGGGQGVVLSETDNILRQSSSAAGVDLNGDGDLLDSVLVGRPSITNTNRFTVVNSLVWRATPNHTFRVAYTYDRAHHRQTGEYGYTDDNFNLENPFFGLEGRPVLTAAGTVAQNRDRTSIALLNQLSGQYIGRFFDQKLRVELGVRSPWFKRDLDQHCYTPVAGTSLSGVFPLCVANPTTLKTGSNFYVIVPNDVDPTTVGSNALYAPFKASYKYHKVLPNVGATFAVNNSLSLFASYSKGLSAPRTDNLYRAPHVDVTPETTDSFDLGARYITPRFQAQGTFWKINYQNRIITAYDPDTNTAVDRNIGKVKSWGFDGGIGFKPIRQLNLIANASYTSAKLQDDLVLGNINYNSATPPAASNITPYTYYCGPIPTTGTAPVPVCARTAGKFVVETPKWMFSGRAEVNLKPVTLGIQAKRVGARWATDVNDVKVKGYTAVDLDARIALGDYLPLKKSYVQLNVINLFNQHYFGNLSTQINAFGFGSAAPRFTPVSTRAVTGTLSLGF